MNSGSLACYGLNESLRQAVEKSRVTNDSFRGMVSAADCANNATSTPSQVDSVTTKPSGTKYILPGLVDPEPIQELHTSLRFSAN